MDLVGKLRLLTGYFSAHRACVGFFKNVWRMVSLWVPKFYHTCTVAEIPLTACACGTVFHILIKTINRYLNLSSLLRNPTPSLFNDKYTFCDKCFNDIAGDTVALTDDPSAPQTWVLFTNHSIFLLHQGGYILNFYQCLETFGPIFSESGSGQKSYSGSGRPLNPDPNPSCFLTLLGINITVFYNYKIIIRFSRQNKSIERYRVPYILQSKNILWWLNILHIFYKSLDPDFNPGSRRPLNPVPDPKHCILPFCTKYRTLICSVVGLRVESINCVG